MDPADLEREIHQALRRLPARHAPDSLRPRVMAAVRAHRALPWYRRSFFSWPVAWQVAGVTAALVAAAAGALLAPTTLRSVADVAVTAWSAAAGAFVWEPPDSVRRALEVINAARVVWRTLLGPLVFYASVFAVLVGGVFAVCAAALTRLTLGRAAA